MLLVKTQPLYQLTDDMNSQDAFEQYVRLKYQLFNSLFITLPFEETRNTGHFLPLLAGKCAEGMKQEATPAEIIEAFFRDNYADLELGDRVDLLFRFVQYIERQVVLFDAIEDAAFKKVTDIRGKGTFHHLLTKINTQEQKQRFVEKLNDFGIRVVLTAHPTQFYPGNVLSIITDLEQAIRHNNVQEINLLIQQLGLTPMYRRKKPTPLDEAIALIWYLENIFYQTVGDIIGDLKNRFPGVEVNPSLIRLGFWPGGDRDGNPFVTADTTLTTARKLKESVVRAYLADVRDLKRKLTFPETDGAIRRIENKLQTTIYRHDDQYYASADELVTDLELIRLKLVNDYRGIHADLLQALIDRVRAFGFFFAEMDIRQDSRVHRKIVSDILTATGNQAQYEACSTLAAKADFWANLNVNDLHPGAFEGITSDSIRTIEVLRTIHHENGSEACHRYIISNTRNAEDLFILHFLFRASGWEGQLPFDLVPLFETIDDLEASSEIMEFLYTHPFYKAHLAQRGNKQTIMLGFSDGTKDGGYVAANWSIFKAKKHLTELSRKYDVKVLFFDGRGGPPARGGGDTHDYYAAHGRSVENHEIQLTIQGQTISSKFGNHESARYNMEQLLTAGLGNHVFQSDKQELTPEQEALMDELGQLSLDAYTRLKEHPKFIDYLDQVTVLNFYGETNVGSRPSKRSAGGKLNLDDLRAIPFVGAWAQMKQNVPGYYGFGDALRAVEASGRGAQLRELYGKSLFFRALIYNSMQALAKTRFELTSYLKHNPEFGEFWTLLKQETDLTVEYLLQLSGYDRLLQEAPVNLSSIGMREEIVLPLLVIQQYALNEYRQAIARGEDGELWKKMVVRCFFGNINASRNSA
ncbi:phosphoenolpyruvate carboxylase type 1 [Breznakibacter xylanolyticus]|uniref:Phosphoenolpyruvate carboxylase n=2 Tax=Breznakibacter xylanolyticus TaxID=990 RepID=A0A2W7NCH4_9BACT|nr:phosphoenolpyruvate carboxylase type 1 [Breznakibacter xylanolyticus]